MKKLRPYEELEIVTTTSDGKCKLRRFVIKAKMMGGLKVLEKDLK